MDLKVELKDTSPTFVRNQLSNKMSFLQNLVAKKEEQHSKFHNKSLYQEPMPKEKKASPIKSPIKTNKQVSSQPLLKKVNKANQLVN